MKGRLNKCLEIKASEVRKTDPARLRASVKWMTRAEYNALWLKQDGKCAICKQECITDKELAIDHCHKTRVVRGLLCSRCNSALGLFRDDLGILENAIIYLSNSVLHN